MKQLEAAQRTAYTRTHPDIDTIGLVYMHGRPPLTRAVLPCAKHKRDTQQITMRSSISNRSNTTNRITTYAYYLVLLDIVMSAYQHTHTHIFCQYV